MEWVVNKLTEVGDDIINVFDTAYDLIHEGSKNQESIVNNENTAEDIFDGSAIENAETSPLEGIASGVIKDILAKQAASGPQTFKENLEAFHSAITWSEPFVIALLAFDLFIILLGIVAARKKYGRIALICVITAVTYAAQYLNDYASLHWESFATQNYFDKNGVFLAIMLCAPLLLIALCMLISLVLEASRLVVKVKIKEIESKKPKSKKKNEKKNEKKKKESKKTK